MSSNNNHDDSQKINGNGPVEGVDISIVKLFPRNERKVAIKYRQRIEASLRAVTVSQLPLKQWYEGSIPSARAEQTNQYSGVATVGRCVWL